MKSKRSLILLSSICLILILAVLPFVAACAAQPTVPAKESIKIGVSQPITGIYAPGGESSLNGYLLWQDIINERGGIYVEEYGKSLPVELIYYDDKSSPEEAIKIYERLIAVDKVDFLLGNWSTRLQVAVLPTIEKYRVPTVGTNSGSLTWRDLEANYFFGTGVLQGADAMMHGLAELLSANKDIIKSVAILYNTDVRPLEDYSVLPPLLEKAGIDIVLAKDYPIGVTDLASVLLEAKGKNPDAVIGLSYPADTILMMKQMMEVGLDPKFYYSLIGPGISAFGMIFGEATEGVAMMGGWTEKSPGDSKLLYDRYMERYGMPPDYLDSAKAWQGAEILAQAIEKAGTLDREKVRDVLATATFETIEGPVQYDGAYVKNQTYSVLQWQKGGVEMIWPPEKATAKPLIPKPAWPE